MKLVAKIAAGTFLGAMAMLSVLVFIVQGAQQDMAVARANASYEAMNRR